MGKELEQIPIVRYGDFRDFYFKYQVNLKILERDSPHRGYVLTGWFVAMNEPSASTFCELVFSAISQLQGYLAI